MARVITALLELFQQLIKELQALLKQIPGAMSSKFDDLKEDASEYLNDKLGC